VAQFYYKAKNLKGKTVKGRMEGSSISEVSEKLRTKGLIPIHIQEQGNRIEITLFKSVKLEEISIFSRQLYTMISAGLSLSDSIDIVIEQTKNPYFRKILSSVSKDIKEGNSFSDSLAKYPKVFPNYYISMVKSGEAGGVLEETLEMVVDYYDKELSLKRKVKSALAYPVFIFLFGIVVIVFMAIYIVPQLAGIVKSTGQKPSFTITMLMQMASFLQSYWYIVVIGIIVGGILAKIYMKKSNLIFYIGNLIPIIKKMNEQVSVSRISLTLPMLTKSGMNLDEAIDMTSDVLEHPKYKKSLKKAAEEIKKGIPLSEILAKEKLDKTLCDMIKIGEETGETEKLLLKLGEFYQQEVEATLSMLLSLLEPAMILLIAGGMGLLVYNIYTAIFQASSGGL
jgi:type IV pilus assembly protein PilC